MPCAVSDGCAGRRPIIADGAVRITVAASERRSVSFFADQSASARDESGEFVTVQMVFEVDYRVAL